MNRGRGGGAQANRIRIIGGRHRGRRLGFAAVSGLRPTPDRVRETLFNWLQPGLRGAVCLDLFAGSGALGLEACSRGAREVVFVEKAHSAARALQENLALLGEQTVCRVVNREAAGYLGSAPRAAFDIAFLDPPFAGGLLAPTLQRLLGADCMRPDAWLYLEESVQTDWPETPVGWVVHREGVAGQTKQCLLRRSTTG